MKDVEYQQIAKAGDELLAELQAESPFGSWTRLLDRFPEFNTRVGLHAAYWIGHGDGESEREMYPPDEIEGEDS
jgi:hypothetical protein